jgi:anti-sigma regulatory factor (Ser/Thr protein kinase)
MKESKKSLILQYVSNNKMLTSKQISEVFDVSEVYASKILNEAVFRGVLKKIGNTNTTKYLHKDVLSEKVMSMRKTFKINKNLSDTYPFEFLKSESSILENASTESIKVLDYIMSEMINNCIDHSEGVSILLKAKNINNILDVSIQDDGVGLFKKVQEYLSIDLDDAILHILKGKLTTAPKYHSGQGLFFSTKAANSFLIVANNKKVLLKNEAQEKTLKTTKTKEGTKVVFSLDLGSKKNLGDLFRKYSGEDFEFSKTSVTVHLFKHKNDLISRSEAKRILFGLEKFKEITLDFANVDTVGQAFCDEVFRVWQNDHTEVMFKNINTNQDVLFMINRV